MKKNKIILLLISISVIGIIIESGAKALLVVIAAVLFSGFCITFPLWLIVFIIDCVLEGFKGAWEECNPIAIYKDICSI